MSNRTCSVCGGVDEKVVDYGGTYDRHDNSDTCVTYLQTAKNQVSAERDQALELAEDKRVDARRQFQAWQSCANEREWLEADALALRETVQGIIDDARRGDGIHPLITALEEALIDKRAGEVLLERMHELEKALQGARMEHLSLEEDCWFSCPKSGKCCNSELPKERCTCGADAHNARIDAVLQHRAHKERWVSKMGRWKIGEVLRFENEQFNLLLHLAGQEPLKEGEWGEALIPLPYLQPEVGEGPNILYFAPCTGRIMLRRRYINDVWWD